VRDRTELCELGTAEVTVWNGSRTDLTEEKYVSVFVQLGLEIGM
jgi:hypothetical protein